MPDIVSKRLIINQLSTADVEFIFALVNSAGWLKFIGDRNVGSIAEANSYIEKILTNTKIKYWVVRLPSSASCASPASTTAVGIVTFIKRDYLPFNDIGFAFLPAYFGHGYAEEATRAVMKHLDYDQAKILATTITTNERSIRLLKKLGFEFEYDLVRDGQVISVYSARFFRV